MKKKWRGSFFPRTAEDYAEYCAEWIAEETDGDLADARWESEQDLRHRMDVSVATRTGLRYLIDQKFKVKP